MSQSGLIEIKSTIVNPHWASRIYTFLWRIRFVVLWLCFLFLLHPLKAAAEEKYQILNLNSYHLGYPWSDTVVEGFDTVLTNANVQYDMHIEYMDTKRHDPALISSYLKELYQAKFADHPFDLILSTDNNAFNLLLEMRDSMFTDTPIIFCGLNEYSPLQIEGDPNITGIIENFDLKETIDLILTLHPEVKYIACITDVVPTGKLHRQRFLNVIKDYTNLIEPVDLAELTAQQLLLALKNLDPNTVIVHLSYHRDPTGRTFSVEEAIQLTKSAGMPIYTCWEQYLGYGVVGGIITSGQAHGELAGNLALSILNGKDPDDIPVVLESPTVPMFDYNLLEEYNIDESLLPEESVIINKPFSLFDKYFYVIISIISAFIVLGTIIILLLINIYNRKKAEEALSKSEQQFRDMFENNTAIMYLLDPVSLELVDANQTASLFYGYPKDRLIGKKITEINVLPESEIRVLIKKINKQAVKSFELIHRLADGTLRNVEVRPTPIVTKDLHKVLFSIVHDITERKLMEGKLKKALEKAEESDRLKSAFLANMSHEIRTPLNAIIGFVDLMLMDREFPEKHRRNMDYVKNSGRLLLYIINDILDLAKIEANQVQLDEVESSIDKIFQDIISSTKVLIMQKKKNINFITNISSEISPIIKLDPTRLTQVINNLINNAIKFTESGIIELGCNIHSNNQLKFYVKDTGIGIPKDKQEVIFNAFEQADDMITKDYGGTGLGLTITKRLVELMKGEIGLSSEINMGSTFYFTIPYQPVSKLRVKEEQGLAFAEKNKKEHTILIVEDEIINQQLIKSLLVKFGFDIFIAENGQEAVSIYKNNPIIDLILMDIKLPNMDGFEAMNIIRGIERRQNRTKVPIIALTAYASKEDIESGLNKGFDDYITKPIEVEKLLSSIKQFLQRSNPLK